MPEDEGKGQLTARTREETARTPGLETSRLLFRPWKKNKSDAKELYRYAKDARVGPAAGWRVHKDPAESLAVIRDILSTPGIYAVVLKETGKPIGAAGLTWGSTGRKYLKADEAEIGYWIGVPWQRKGFATEAVRALIRFAFEQLRFQTLWCAWYEGNTASARVQEKCGFVYDHTDPASAVAALGEVRTEHFMKLTREQWEQGGYSYAFR